MTELAARGPRHDHDKSVDLHARSQPREPCLRPGFDAFGKIGAFTGNGNELNNLLLGGNGNDKLDGKVGADTLIGVLGNDTYGVDNVNDVVVEKAGEGIDRVVATVSYTLSDNVENLQFTTGSRSTAPVTISTTC